MPSIAVAVQKIENYYYGMYHPLELSSTQVYVCAESFGGLFSGSLKYKTQTKLKTK
jgi:hypothetical protein